MKSLTQSLFVVLLLVLSQSCSIQKRVHLPGYHISGKRLMNKKLSTDKKEKVCTTAELNETKEIIVDPITEKEEVRQIDWEPDYVLIEEDLSKKESIRFLKTLKSPEESVKKVNTREFIQTKTTDKSIFHRKSLKVKENENDAEKSGSSALKAIGWIFIVLGIIFVLLISILIGILFMLLGLVFVLAGKS